MAGEVFPTPTPEESARTLEGNNGNVVQLFPVFPDRKAVDTVHVSAKERPIVEVNPLHETRERRDELLIQAFPPTK